MANADKPAGFKVGYTKHGGPAALNRYNASGTGAIYKGDVVCIGAITGTVMTADTSSDSVPLGVAAHYSVGTATTLEVLVYDDLQNTVFIAQGDGADIAGSSLTPALYDITWGKSTTTQQSIHEVDTSSSLYDHLKVIDKVDRPDNAWGSYVDLYVEFIVDPYAHARTVTATT